MQIFRYSVKRLSSHSGVLRPQEIKLPKNAKVIDAIYQAYDQGFYIFVEDDPEMIERDRFNVRKFTILSTGEDIPEKAKHIRSIVMPDGSHVFHVYEVA